LKLVSGSDFGQIFISDSNKHRLQSIVSDAIFYEAEGGAFTKDE